MSDEQPSYISYLLRLWRANEAGKNVWRASLEDPKTGKRIGFATLDRLVEYLQVRTRHDSARGDQSPPMNDTNQWPRRN